MKEILSKLDESDFHILEKLGFEVMQDYSFDNKTGISHETPFAVSWGTHNWMLGAEIDSALIGVLEGICRDHGISLYWDNEPRSKGGVRIVWSTCLKIWKDASLREVFNAITAELAVTKAHIMEAEKKAAEAQGWDTEKD